MSWRATPVARDTVYTSAVDGPHGLWDAGCGFPAGGSARATPEAGRLQSTMQPQSPLIQPLTMRFRAGMRPPVVAESFARRSRKRRLVPNDSFSTSGPNTASTRFLFFQTQGQSKSCDLLAWLLTNPTSSRQQLPTPA